MRVNYYDVLGVDKTASDAEIRDHFRKLARENHPDRYRGPDKASAERKFQTLTEAVNVLTNPLKRKQHDSELQSNVPRSPTDLTQVAKVYVAKGVKSYKEGDFKAAYENFDMAVKHNPQDAKAFHYLALACARLPGMTRQAVQAIETAVQREPLNPLFLKDAGLFCKRAGLSAKAERYLEEALKWDQDNPDILTALSELRQAREPKEAAKGIGSFFKKG
jgi:curved DNA-binding protein CbpA